MHQPRDLAERIRRLELQSHTILYLSALNMFMNAAMLAVGLLLGCP